MQEDEFFGGGEKGVPDFEEHDRQVQPVLPNEETSAKTIKQTNLRIDQNHKTNKNAIKNKLTAPTDPLTKQTQIKNPTPKTFRVHFPQTPRNDPRSQHA